MKALVDKLRAGRDLTAGDINYAMSLLLSESTDDKMKADFLVALHRKGESVEEIVAFVQHLIDRAIDPLIDPKNLSGPMIDVCGTGGGGQTRQSRRDLAFRKRRCARSAWGPDRAGACPPSGMRRATRALFYFRA